MWTVAELIEIKDVNENGVRFILNYNEKNKHNCNIISVCRINLSVGLHSLYQKIRLLFLTEC